MATYYIVNMNTRELVRTSHSPFNIDEAVQPPSPLIQLKRVDNDTVPSFNAATQKVIRSSIDNDTLFTRTFYFEVVSLSQAEIDANQLNQTDEATRILIKNGYMDLKNGAGTTAERAARLERAVAWLLRQYVKNGN